jgi:hypothetical protein
LVFRKLRKRESPLKCKNQKVCENKIFLLLDSITTVLAIFVALNLIGFSSFCIAKLRRPSIGEQLLCGSFGFALLSILLFWCAQLGVPLLIAGRIVMGVLIVLSVSILFARKQNPISQDSVLILCVPVVLCFVACEWPLAKFGSDWTAFGSGDWTFYILNAEALARHGYALPALTGLVDNTDIASLGSVYLNVSGRQGAEIFLAGLMSIFGRPAVDLYMPALVVAQLLIVQASMAMGWFVLRRRSIPLAIALFTAFSPELNYAVLFQLLPQELGISLLVASVSWIFSAFREKPEHPIRYYGISATFLASLVLVYPELTPFLVLCVIAGAIFSWREIPVVLRFVSGLAFSAACAAILVFNDLSAASQWIFGISKDKTGSSAHTILYPSFLQVEGFLNFWGLHAIGSDLGSYTAAIILLIMATLLSICLIVATVDLSMRRVPAALVVLPLLLVATRFALTKQDFTMFKLAMYSQPFVIGVMVLWIAIRCFNYRLHTT